MTHYPVGEPHEGDESRLQRLLREMNRDESPVNVFEPPPGFPTDPHLVSQHTYNNFVSTQVSRDWTAAAIGEQFADEDLNQQLRNEMMWKAAQVRNRVMRRAMDPNDPTVPLPEATRFMWNRGFLTMQNSEGQESLSPRRDAQRMQRDTQSARIADANRLQSRLFEELIMSPLGFLSNDLLLTLGEVANRVNRGTDGSSDLIRNSALR